MESMIIIFETGKVWKGAFLEAIPKGIIYIMSYRSWMSGKCLGGKYLGGNVCLVS